ncbi:MAG TPA: laminin G, partial [Ignavibacteria bacterium]|nr:laminin G [Ignavibacteria bacterium]
MRRVFISKYFYVIVIGILLPLNEVLSQQISISRIEQMPNSPSSFEIPDWKNVAIEYDSLVYNLNAAGEYLPLIFIITNTINYPAQNSFGLHSYVGTNYPNLGEAINVIPSIIGASLSGIDKSNQNGYNWVLMSEEYFNKRKGEEVYLNTPNSSSGNDWWYDTMPDVFFYQLFSLYPNTGDFNYQFT